MILQLTHSHYITSAIAALISIALGLVTARRVANEPNAYIAGYTWLILLMFGSGMILCLLIAGLVSVLGNRPKLGLLLVLCAVLLAGSYLVGFAVMQRFGWTNFREEMTPIISGENNLIILFEERVTREQIEELWHSTLSFHEYPFIDGKARIPSVQGHEAIAVSFSSGVTESQREDIKSKVNASPIVYKVMENIAWNKMEDIE